MFLLTVATCFIRAAIASTAGLVPSRIQTRADAIMRMMYGQHVDVEMGFNPEEILVVID